MGSRQILDTYGRKARARPGTTSLYPVNTGHGEVGGQRFRGHGLVVGRAEKSIFEVPAQALSGVSYWDDILSKRGKLSWNH